MRKMFKKMCIGACGLMFVPILAMVPVNAENASSTQVPMAATGSIEGTPVPSVSPSASPGSDSIASPQLLQTPTADTGSWRRLRR